MEKPKLASLVLRIGIAFTFFYAAISALVVPDAWIGYYPEWIKNLFPASFLLLSHSILELALGFWLLSGRGTFYAATVSALWLLGIILGTFGLFLVTFRDVAIFSAAVALAILNKE